QSIVKLIKNVNAFPSAQPVAVAPLPAPLYKIGRSSFRHEERWGIEITSPPRFSCFLTNTNNAYSYLNLLTTFNFVFSQLPLSHYLQISRCARMFTWLSSRREGSDVDAPRPLRSTQLLV
ncbi:hypothetical protein C0J52_24021, partial [Blattella germanica]